MKNVYLILIVLFLLVGCSNPIASNITSDKSCQRNSDCVLVSKPNNSNKCCGDNCSVEAINIEASKKRTEENKDCFKDKSYIEVCGDIDCEIIDVRAKCVNNNCVAE